MSKGGSRLSAGKAVIESSSDQGGIRPAIDMEILSGDVSGELAADERTQRAEFFRPAEPPGGNAVGLSLARHLVADVLALGGLLGHVVLPVGVDPLGQKIVDRDVVARDIQRDR